MLGRSWASSARAAFARGRNLRVITPCRACARGQALRHAPLPASSQRFELRVVRLAPDESRARMLIARAAVRGP
jgi:hypothetical protein